MNNFTDLSTEQRLTIFTQTGVKTGLPAYAVEKDWGVTQISRIVFSLSYPQAFVFKGGTSLSKGYNLIQRFSEDIDLAIDRAYFNKSGKLSRNQIKKLRKASGKFISTTFLDDIIKSIEESQLPISSIGVEPFESTDTDPLRIYITYDPLTEENKYLPPRILLEISCRSLREPCEDVLIESLIDTEYKTQTFAMPSFPVKIVEPQRTFLEKVCLLHEEWQKENIRVDRLSRHLYDLERLMDTKYSEVALANGVLFYHIVEHRIAFTAVKGVDYDNHKPRSIRIIPPDSVINAYEKDYNDMKESMFAGESLTWEELMDRLRTLQKEINNLNW